MLTYRLFGWVDGSRSERTFFSSVWMENGGGWSRSEMEYSQHMRVGPVRQNLADEFDPRGFRPSRDGRETSTRRPQRRGAVPSRDGARWIELPPPARPPAAPLPLQADGGAEGRVDPGAARRSGGGGASIRWRHVDPSAGLVRSACHDAPAPSLSLARRPGGEEGGGGTLTGPEQQRRRDRSPRG